jgi:hypothetical protein
MYNPSITDDTRHEKLEELLYKLRRARWLHRRATKYYQPRNNIILALSFIVSGSISILSITNTDSSNNINSNQRQYIGYAITLIGFINGLITLISNQLDYKTKINNNNLASKAYDRLITQVSFEINFPSEVPINEFVGLVEENILKLKNELEVMTESRFEKEINRMIDNGFDISSDAGYMPKKPFFNFFNKKNKDHNISDLDSECKTTNPIKKHQQNKKDSEFIKQYKKKIIQETMLDDIDPHNYNDEYRYHPHFEDQPIPTPIHIPEKFTSSSNNNCNINIDIDESHTPPQSEYETEPETEPETEREHTKSYSIFNFIRSFFSSSMNKNIEQKTSLNQTLSNDVADPPVSTVALVYEPTQLSTQSHPSLESESNNYTMSQRMNSSNKRNESSQSRSQSSRPLPLSVFNMRKI